MLSSLWKAADSLFGKTIPPPLEDNNVYVSTGNSVEYEYRKLDHELVIAICTWNNMIVTGSFGEVPLRFWTPSGKSISCYVQGLTQPKKPVHVLHVWDDILITSAESGTQCWKLISSNSSSSQTEIRIECAYAIKPFPLLNSRWKFCTVWNDLLYVSLPYWLLTYDKEGNQKSRSQTNQEIFGMLVFQGDLWTCSRLPTIYVWRKRTNGTQYYLAKNLSGHSAEVNVLCTWGKDHVASGSNDCHVRVWNQDLECVFSLYVDGQVRALTVWNNKLVCGVYQEGSRAKNIISIWNWNKSLYQQFEMKDNIQVIMGYEDRMWHTDCKSLKLWRDPRSWKTERLLWIAWKKNDAKDCLLAGLPKELVHVIISFLRK